MVAVRRLSLDVVAPDQVCNKITLYQSDISQRQLILCLPAMGVPARKYEALATALAHRGLVAACCDLRGHGHSSIRPSREVNFSYADMVEQDLPAVLRVLNDAYPDHEIYLLGHSLGGQIAALFLSQQPQAAAGLVLAASCSVYYRGWRWPHSWSILLFSQVACLVSRIVGYFPGHRFKFGGNEARGVMRDWAHNARTGRYRLVRSSTPYEQDLAKVELPVLTLSFADDGYAPYSATEVLLAKLSGVSNLTSHTLSGHDLNTRRADHFNWVRRPDAVVRLIENWLKTDR